MNGKAHKSRYNDDELKEFEAIIDKKLNRAQEQLQYITEQLSDTSSTNENKVRGLDDGTGTAENEQLSVMASRLQKHIQHLENAKIRIKNKVYGICRQTGELISKERLRAVPHATLSIKAKQKKR